MKNFKTSHSTLLLILVQLLILVKSQDVNPASAFNLRCQTCLASNSTFFYCTKDQTCRSTQSENLSCENTPLACLAYRSDDLGVKEIPPFTKIRASFNYTVNSQKAIRFAISNQDSKTKGWFKIMVKNAPLTSDESITQDYSEDTTEIINISDSILDALPSGLHIKYFDQNTGDMKTDFVYTKTGKSYLKPLNTRFLYVYALNDTRATIQVLYGNTKFSLFGLSFLNTLTLGLTAVVLLLI